MHTLDTAPEQNIRPTVTVIVPCHNHADMVGEAIDSVIKQDYRPINIAVVDDGSKDNPEPVIRQKIESVKDEEGFNIFYIKNESPTGPSAARNKGIQEMWDKSDVFMMLDADDLYLPGKVEKSIEKFLEYPEHIGIVYTDAIIQNINTGTQVHEFRAYFDRQELEKECIISNTPLVSKKALQECGGYDEEMRTCEDWDLWLRITESFIAIHIPEALHVYHVTGKNSSDIVSQETWRENWGKISQRIAERKNVSSY